MQEFGRKLGDLTGASNIDVLRGMTVDLHLPLAVDDKDAGSIRTAIYRIHKDETTYNKYHTAKSPTGILVWRIE